MAGPNIRPLGQNVLLRRLEAEEKTKEEKTKLEAQLKEAKTKLDAAASAVSTPSSPTFWAMRCTPACIAAPIENRARELGLVA